MVLQLENRLLITKLKSQTATRFPHKLWAILTVGGVAFIDLFRRFYREHSIYGGFDDDFFYYAQVAKHLAHGAGSTFDGIHLTNGYHPLWLLVLTLFSVVDNGRLLFVLVSVAALLSLASIFGLSMLCLRKLGIPIAGQYVIVTLVTFWSDILLRGGMEVTLALPLILLLIYLWLDRPPHTSLSFFQLGSLASLCILARLDSAIFIALLFFATMRFEPQPFAVWLKRTFAFGLGLLPFWTYLVLNKVFFGALMPSSAQAKQLRLHHAFRAETLISLFYPFTAVRLILVLPCLICIVLFLVLLLKKSTEHSRASAHAKPVLWALALFPLLHLASLCFLSDWPLWYWYFYPLVLAALGSLAAWAARNPLSSERWASLAIVVTLIIAGYTSAFHIHHPPSRNPILLVARDVADFAKTHPDTYAMGDRSGTVGYLLPSPLIQLEGLTMDRAYLLRLRAQPPLETMLHEYRVRYYISTDAVFEKGCYLVREPARAGRDSAHMSGAFCQPPLAVFSHDGIITRIFDVAGK
jgi:hypothetical protein